MDSSHSLYYSVTRLITSNNHITVQIIEINKNVFTIYNIIYIRFFFFCTSFNITFSKLVWQNHRKKHLTFNTVINTNFTDILCWYETNITCLIIYIMKTYCIHWTYVILCLTIINYCGLLYVQFSYFKFIINIHQSIHLYFNSFKTFLHLFTFEFCYTIYLIILSIQFK